MSEHLPECPYVVFDQQGLIPATVIPGGCICSALRACEARLEDEWLNRYNAAEQRGYDAGFRNGVRAARDAVSHDEACLSNDADADDRDCNCWRPVAFAAIDALRGES